MYVDGEVIEKMIVTILEGFERIEAEAGPHEPPEGLFRRR